MDAGQLESLATLRTIVGYLGEREHFGWWQSSFFASGSEVFLAPLFAHTQLLARCNGVTQAAALVHDERVGVGHVYHLFRLPEDLEQGIHRALQDPTLCTHVTALISSRESALAWLCENACSQVKQSVGPVLVGEVSDLRTPGSLCVLAFHYNRGCTTGVPAYPFFSGKRA